MLPDTRLCYLYTCSYAYSGTMICVVLYVPDTGMAYTSVITPNACDYCSCFAAIAADVCDGALYWCCFILTAALLLLGVLLLLCIAYLLLTSC